MRHHHPLRLTTAASAAGVVLHPARRRGGGPRPGLSLAAASLLLASPAAAWTRAGSERYGTSIDVPDGYRALRAPDNGDGRTFLSPDGRARIAVFAAQDVLEGSFAEPADVTVTYRAHGPDWSVYSGTQGTRIVYERMLAACADHHLVHHVRIDYEGTDRARMAATVARVAGSLRGSCAE